MSVPPTATKGPDAGAKVGSRHLAGLLGLRREVDDVIDELERDTDFLAVLDDRCFESVRGVGEDQTGLGGQGDERACFVCEHLNVVLFGIFVVSRANGFVQLPEDETLEGVSLQLGGAFAEAGHELGGTGKQQVTGEDRD